MAFDFGPGTDDNRHATQAPSGRASRHARLSVTVSTGMVAVLVGAIAVASCSSLDSNSTKTGTGGAAAGGRTGAGGMVAGTGGNGMGGSASGGNNGTGGDAVDAAVDAPATDAPVPCGPNNDCCPNDPNKTDPGMCGCGVVDSTTDTDSDGVPDCIDECPSDPGKFTAGVCGCGIPDVNTMDTDGDGTLDCLDQCPRDPTRTKAGVCGCGIADTAPLCLAHRYQFNDVTSTDGGVADGGSADAGAGSANPPGTPIHDSVGTADGVAVRATLTGNGSVTLVNPALTAADGTQDQYIQLPPHIISSLGNSATFETWVNWTGGAVWQRIFDFGGNSNGTVGMKGAGSFFIFLSPASGIAPNGTFISFVSIGNPVNEVSAPTALTANAMQHVAVVVDNTTVDGGAASVILYVNGVRVNSVALNNTLSTLPDDNNWLGRSQFTPDPSFGGTYYEFRIYSTARTAAQIAASFAAGPDTLPAN